MSNDSPAMSMHHNMVAQRSNHSWQRMALTRPAAGQPKHEAPDSSSPRPGTSDSPLVQRGGNGAERKALCAKVAGSDARFLLAAAPPGALRGHTAAVGRLADPCTGPAGPCLVLHSAAPVQHFGHS